MAGLYAALRLLSPAGRRLGARPMEGRRARRAMASAGLPEPEGRRAIQVTVLEAARRCGGRARQICPPGLGRVAGGAGIGRLRKDRLLRGLLDELRVPWRRFRHRVEYRGPPAWVNGARPWLRSALARLRKVGPKRGETFGAFVRRGLGGEEPSRRFWALLGFGDDENADAAETLRGYGFEDNFALGWGMSVPWNRLAAAMVREIRRRGGRVVTGCRVAGVRPVEGVRRFPERSEGEWSVKCAGKRPGREAADAVLLAVPASQMRRLVRGLGPKAPSAARLLADVRAQSFLYAYARLKGRAPPGLPQTYTVLAGSPLQKVIPMHGRVYMVAYADNARARQLRREGCAGILRRAQTALGARFTACALRWNAEGTHYFAPLPARFRSRAHFLRELRGSLPAGLFVAGEALSEGHQGWVEGALRDAAGEVSRIQQALGAGGPPKRLLHSGRGARSE
jgi:hypothetical protein